MVILVDDAERENEGDLVLAAQFVTPEAINFMAKHARGLICLSLTEEQVRGLGLTMMVSENQSTYSTAFTVSIEAARGVTTGISAADRATTIKAAINPEARPEDLVRPGHIFPLRARKGGVLVRAGQTEGSVDLARLAGLIPAGVICEVMNDDGTMAREDDLEKFAAAHGLHILSVADVIHYRMQREALVRRGAEARVPTEFGAQILRDVGVRKLRLMTNNPKKIDGLKRLYDLEVVERVPIEVGHGPENEGYLQVKRDKMGHLLSLPKK